MSTRHSASKKRRISRTINGMTNLNQLNTMQSLGSTSPVVGTKRKKKTTRKPTNSHSANMNAPTARKTQHHTAKAFGEAGGVYQAIGDFIVAMDADLLAMRNNCVEQGHALAEQMKKYQNNMHSPYQQTNLRRSALLQQAIDQSGGLNPLNTTEKRLQMRNSKSNFTETIQSLNNMEIDSELVESIDSYENKMKVAGNEFDLANLALFNNANKLISTSLELTADGNTVLVCKLQKQKFSLSERTLLAEEIVNLKLSTHGGGKSEGISLVINKALNSTLSRTFNTSMTIIVVLLAILIFGTGSLQGFAFALLIGVIVGTYSSICIASPIYTDLVKKNQK